jgi:hypothetical protein
MIEIGEGVKSKTIEREEIRKFRNSKKKLILHE